MLKSIADLCNVNVLIGFWPVCTIIQCCVFAFGTIISDLFDLLLENGGGGGGTPPAKHF